MIRRPPTVIGLRQSDVEELRKLVDAEPAASTAPPAAAEADTSVNSTAGDKTTDKAASPTPVRTVESRIGLR
jgi:hypothetical protein